MKTKYFKVVDKRKIVALFIVAERRNLVEAQLNMQVKFPGSRIIEINKDVFFELKNKTGEG